MSKNAHHSIDYSKIVDQGVNPSFYHEIFHKILNYIANNNSANFNEIISYVGGGERRVVRLLDEMVNLNILSFKSSKFYSPKSKNYNLLQSDARCVSCDSKIANINGKIKPLLTFVKKVIKERPKSTFIFDQRPVNAETIARRVSYMIWRGDLQDKKIVMIGDDDLTSVALAQTHLANEIVVFDIDERILNLIDKISKTYKLNIKTVKQDLLKNIPANYMNYFDTFITDPTPTLQPLTLFTSRGLQLLKKGKGSVGYISLYPSHMPMKTDFQEVLSKMNILITDLIPFFNQYEIIAHTLSKNDIELLKKYAAPPDSISFYEYLMRTETTHNSKILPIQYSLIDLIGKATKQALENPSTDPVLSDEKGEVFIKKSAGKLKKLLNGNQVKSNK